MNSAVSLVTVLSELGGTLVFGTLGLLVAGVGLFLTAIGLFLVVRLGERWIDRAAKSLTRHVDQ